MPHVALHGEAQVEFQPASIGRKSFAVSGTFSGDARSHALALKFLELHQRDFPSHKMITGCYKLDGVNMAMDRMKNPQEIKPMILV